MKLCRCAGWGSARVIDDPAWLSAQIDEMTGQQEEGMAEPWAVTDAPREFIASQLKGITGVEILVQRLEGKWKASQNQTPATQECVAAGLRERNPTSAMAKLVEGSGSS